jgi:predicted ABC-type ATPase
LNSNKVFYVFAGPNGSGKSTLIAQFTKENPSVEYVCADQIAAEEAFRKLDNEQERNQCALHEAEARVERLIALNLSFAYETVLSSQYKWRLIELAKQNEYCIISTYVTTRSANICVARVAKRVQANGHAVSEEKIRSRYDRSMCNLGHLLQLSDAAIVFDNSDDADTLTSVKRLLWKELDDNGILHINPTCVAVYPFLEQWIRESGATKVIKLLS